MKQEKVAVYMLAVAFTFNELVLNFFVFHAGFSSLPRTLVTIFVYLVLFFVSSRNIVWAKWVLIILLVLYGVTFFLGKWNAFYYGIGLYYIILGILVRWSLAIRNADVEEVPLERKDFRFLSLTSKFAIVGVFIPGFTAILILGLQSAIQKFDIECAESWELLWEITTVGAITLPLIFFGLQYLKNSSRWIMTKTSVVLFDIIEYTFIQCALARMFTTGQTFCHGSGGQNGIEFVFTGWTALPVLGLLSLGFDYIGKESTLG